MMELKENTVSVPRKMSFQTVWVFTAIIMVCVINGIVEAHYRFPMYDPYGRRFSDGENLGMQDNIIEVKRPDQIPPIGSCDPKNCRTIPMTLEHHSRDENPSEDKAPDDILPHKSKTDVIPYKRVYQNFFHRHIPKTFWGIEANGDKDYWSEKQAIQHLPLKPWTDWNKKSHRGNGK